MKVQYPSLVFLICLLLILLSFTSTAMAQSANITVTGASGYYEARNSVGTVISSGSDASTVITAALVALSSGQTISFSGTFTISSTITINKASITLDLNSATMTLTTNTVLFSITGGGGQTFLSGHLIGPTTGASTAIRAVNSANCMFDGVVIDGFTGDPGGVVILGYGTSYMTVQNCKFFGTIGASSTEVNLVNSGYNNIFNCVFGNMGQGIFAESTASYNQIIGCEFYNWHQGGFGHAIYLDGINGLGGHNTVSGCTFHDQVASNGAGLQIKCPDNIVSANTFRSFTNQGAPCFSIYSQYSPSYANNNDIHDNSFTDCVTAFWLGHNPAAYPTTGNKIHDNIFTRVTNGIMMNPWSGAINTVEDTWVYYNTFSSCVNPFPVSDSSASFIVDTVIAYNMFSSAVPSSEVTWLTSSCTNTMVYGNTGLTDFNVPSPLQIAPPNGSLPTPQPSPSPSASPTPTPIGQSPTPYGQTPTPTDGSAYPPSEWGLNESQTVLLIGVVAIGAVWLATARKKGN